MTTTVEGVNIFSASIQVRFQAKYPLPRQRFCPGRQPRPAKLSTTQQRLASTSFVSSIQRYPRTNCRPHWDLLKELQVLGGDSVPFLSLLKINAKGQAEEDGDELAFVAVS
jgi:hypothetical protein